MSNLVSDFSTSNFRSVSDDDIALLCTKCEYRNNIYLLNGKPFCDISDNTCSRRYFKSECSDYLRKQPVQLSLF